LLFIDPSRVTDEIRAHFAANKVQVTIKNYNEIFSVLESLAGKAEGKVWISHGSSQALTELVPKHKRHQDITPINIMKAIKNDIEAQGMRNCHVRDGVALVRYFSWLENEVLNKRAVTEISGATKLEQIRSRNEKFMGLSFGTINGSGPNGSIIHYHPKNETNREINDKEMYLCDSGAQYLDGTTDVTRTWHFGQPSDYERECFTRVFKGQWQMGTLVFPNKTKGRALDSLARKYLWDYGLDYGHGTGHGIGSFLNVHEGPMGIGEFQFQLCSKKHFVSVSLRFKFFKHFCFTFNSISSYDVSLLTIPNNFTFCFVPNLKHFAPIHCINISKIISFSIMFQICFIFFSVPFQESVKCPTIQDSKSTCSFPNEPGYYEDGQFGIRIEDIVQIVSANVPKDFNGRGALTFHTITLCPIHTKLIKVELLTEEERRGLNAYHKRVYDTLAPLLDPNNADDSLALKWLKKETNPI
jgi:Xaa-Pro aminopeptidase